MERDEEVVEEEEEEEDDDEEEEEEEDTIKSYHEQLQDEFISELSVPPKKNPGETWLVKSKHPGKKTLTLVALVKSYYMSLQGSLNTFFLLR